MALRKKAMTFDDSLEDASKSWIQYPYNRGEFLQKALPLKAFNNHVSDMFQKAKGMMRSASATRFMFRKPLRRTNSYSSLSPSHGLPYADRTPERYISTFKVYRTKADSWLRERDASELRAAKHRSLDLSYHHEPINRVSEAQKIEQAKRECLSLLNDRNSLPILRPTSWTRWQLPVLYHHGRVNGLRIMSPHMYTNYDRDDDRAYVRYINDFCRIYPCHWRIRLPQKTYYVYHPYKLSLIYGHMNK